MMNATASRAPAQAPQASPETLAMVRQNVKELLTKSQAFLSLPPDKQKEIARQTVEVASYLAEPEGIRGNKLPTAQAAAKQAKFVDPYAFSMADNNARRSGPPKEGEFVAQAAREGAAVAGALLQAVDFPNFVSGLIEGVFHSIVKSSIEQMEAYGRLVADVAKSLNQFRDENVSVNQGRDHLVEQFPDLFQVDVDTGEEGRGPRVRLRDGVDESEALRKVNSSLPLEGDGLKSLDLEDDEVEDKLVQSARTQLATSRQQLLATMVLMGINRIVVTDGKISAKVVYDFQARDNFKFQKSATKMDYARDASGNLARMRNAEGEWDDSREGGQRTYSEGKLQEDRRGSYYSKGAYKYAEQPVISMVSASQTSTDASLQTKASLAGVVEVNFKSDYFPLEKMADSFQIGQIQNAAQPGQARAANAAQPANAAQQPAASTTTPAKA